MLPAVIKIDAALQFTMKSIIFVCLRSLAGGLLEAGVSRVRLCA